MAWGAPKEFETIIWTCSYENILAGIFDHWSTKFTFWDRRPTDTSFCIRKTPGILSVCQFAIDSISVPLKKIKIYCRNDSNVSQSTALIYGTTICILTIVPGMASSHSLFKVFCSGTKVRVAVCSLIYRKVLSQFALFHKELSQMLSNLFIVFSLFNYLKPFWAKRHPENWPICCRMMWTDSKLCRTVDIRCGSRQLSQP